VEVDAVGKTKSGKGEHEHVTLQTIADAVGVSRTTVSNAFNRPDQMSPGLLRKILSMADELGYCGPDPAAAVLRRGRSGTFGILFTESLAYAISDPTAHLFLQGVTQATEEAAIRLLLLPSPEDRASGVTAVREAVVDGFLVYTLPTGDPLLQAVLGRRLPTVIVDEPRVPGAGFVSVDDEGGARALARHLLELGHRSFGLITWPLKEDGFEGFAPVERQRHAVYPVAANRLTGFAEEAAQAGIDWDGVPVYEVPLNSAANGARAARALFARDPRSTAIVALSDVMAIAAMEEAAAQGLGVPGDVSIAGYDNIPAAAAAIPPLTTVAQPLVDKGLAAAWMLMEGWEGEPPVVSLATKLIVRGSTGPVF
jgi:DNA-binding LacI/PurR family transcriptional regulator